MTKLPQQCPSTNENIDISWFISLQVGLLLCNLQRAKFQKLCIRALITIISYHNFGNVTIIVRAKIIYNLNNYDIRC